MKQAMFRTISGTYIDLLHPRPTDINIRDIAHGLSNLCRFNGQTPEFYSVAQHSVLCYWLAKIRGCTPQECFACLLHDAAEAYIGDLVRPLKQHLPSFVCVEQGIDAAIAESFQFDHRDYHNLVKSIDLQALAVEKKHLFPEDLTVWDELGNVEPIDVPYWACWSPTEACEAFLEHVRICLIAVEKSAAETI